MRHLRASMQKVQTRSGPARLWQTVVRDGKVLVLALGLVGCSALDVNSPTTTRIGDVQNPEGAHLFLNGIYNIAWGGLIESIASSGALADEFGWGNGGANDLWQRKDSIYLARLREPDHEKDGVLYKLQQAWISATLALTQLRANGTQVDLGEAYALRSFFMIQMGEIVCPGFPVADVSFDGESITPLFTSDPQTEDSAFVRSLADADSALTHATEAGRVNSFAKVTRARALLGLGRFAEAAVAASDVPTEFEDTVSVPFNLISMFRDGLPIQDRKGGNGLDFVSANDPRVVVVDQWGYGTYSLAKYLTGSYSGNPLVISTGIEARLIEAESQLATGGPWLATLNTLRARVGLSDTTDPGTTAGRVDLVMRERAFWLFASAHRLGDLRRMMRLYGRDPETIFPTGADTVNGFTYGTATSVPFNGVLEHTFNPKITGCTD